MNVASFAARYDAAEQVNTFGPPEMDILTAGRSKATPMPSELFGSTWPLIADLAEGAGAPVDYVAISLLAVSASLIGGKRRISPYETSDWSEPCILWTAAVGDPSSNKSPALDAATGPLRAMEADHALDHESLMRDWEARAQRAKVERKAWEADVEQARKERLATPPLTDDAIAPEEPERRRLLVQDSTPEALASILAGNPMGTLHLRDELAGWWMGFDRYAPGGREFWLEAYGGRAFTIDRKSAKTALRIPFNGVSVVGGVQPEKLAECLLSGADDGLVPRFLWAWPAPIPYSRPQRIADRGRLERLYRRLDDLRPGRDEDGQPKAITLLLTPQGSDLFEAWMREHVAAIGEAASLFKSFCGKLQGMVLRLALVGELIAWADGQDRDEPERVSAKTLVAAIRFVEDYAKPTAQRVFGDAALPPVERHAASLARYILKMKPDRINAREIRRSSGIPSLKDSDNLKAAIEFLIEADWLKAVATRAGETPGRGKADYLVNPAVLAHD